MSDKILTPEESLLDLYAHDAALRVAVEGLKAMVLSKEAQLETARKASVQWQDTLDIAIKERDEWKSRAQKAEARMCP